MDAARGFSVLSMVAFHFCYDLRYVCGRELAWFAPPFQDVWRASIAWTFLAIAGFMCSLSRNNWRRGGIYAAVALAVTIVTSLAGVDVPITFGIIFCMAASTLLFAALDTLGYAPKGALPAVVFLLAFLSCLNVAKGYFGLTHLIALPKSLYSTELFSWLGFPGPTFSSGDYYPMIPFTLIYLAGASVGRAMRERGFPSWMSEWGFSPLEFVGRHALIVYALHQPILLLLAGAL